MKPNRSPDIPVPASMRKDRVFGAVLVAGGALAMWMGGSAIVSGIVGIRQRDQLVAYHGLDATAFFAGLGLLAIGFVALLPVSQAFREQNGRGAAPRPALALPLMVFAAVCIVGSPLSGSIGRVVLDSMATSQEYVRCPSPRDARHQPDRWTLPSPAGRTASCPR